MRLPAFLMRLWARLTGSVSGYVQEPTLEEQRAMQAVFERAVRGHPMATFAGKFDVNDGEGGG